MDQGGGIFCQDTGDSVWQYRTRFVYAEFMMIFTAKIVTMLLVAISMSLSLAHALELPGKRRLDRATYLVVQTIYYPGFTFGGIAEPLSVVATLVLFFLIRNYSPWSWLVIFSFALLAMMHLIFWDFVQPVNKFWLQNEKLTATGNGSSEPKGRREARGRRAKTLRTGWLCGTDGNILTSSARAYRSWRLSC